MIAELIVQYSTCKGDNVSCHGRHSKELWDRHPVNHGGNGNAPRDNNEQPVCEKREELTKLTTGLYSQDTDIRVNSVYLVPFVHYDALRCHTCSRCAR